MPKAQTHTHSIDTIFSPSLLFTLSSSQIPNMDSMQSWIQEHKLTSIGALWASAIAGSLAFTRAKSPLKPSLRLIHARMHAQALTLAVLSGAAAMHYWESKSAKTTVDVVNAQTRAHFAE